MKFCSNCGQPVQTNARFCFHCGYKLSDDHVETSESTVKVTEGNKADTRVKPVLPVLKADTEKHTESQVKQADNYSLQTEFERKVRVLCSVLMGTFKLDSQNNVTLLTKFNRIKTRISKKIRGYEFDELGTKIGPLLEDPSLVTKTDVETVSDLIDRYQNYYALSQLEKQLATLSGQSSNAIVDTEHVTKLQSYLHVDRPEIQQRLKQAMQGLNQQSGKLILLVGNVGDGKSHLLGYMKEKYPELFSNFKIHYDATESLDPQKTAMDTLQDVLTPFTDEKVDENRQNLIIAINMGVLVNLVHVLKPLEQYHRLLDFIEKTNVTDSTINTKQIDNLMFELISFRDYPLFEIDESGCKSSFYDELFSRIVDKVNTNPFYCAYESDKNKHILHITHYNYELFTHKSVRKTLKYLLIKIQVESKAIISTRAILELIHDILMPVEGLKETELETYENLLPYLLFGGQGDSNIVKKIQRFDPLQIQSAEIEAIGRRIYNTHRDLKNLANDIFGSDASKINWLWGLIPRPSDARKDDENFHQLVGILIRLKYLLQHDDVIFDDHDYLKFLALLSAVKQSNYRSKVVTNFEKAVLNFIFSWNGSIDKNYMFTFINEQAKFGIAVPVVIQFKQIHAEEFNVAISFYNNSGDIEGYSLVIDFELFELIQAVSCGYLLKSEDKRRFANVANFVENLSKGDRSMNETIIGNVETKHFYKLLNDGIEVSLEEKVDEQ